MRTKLILRNLTLGIRGRAQDSGISALPRGARGESIFAVGRCIRRNKLLHILEKCTVCFTRQVVPYQRHGGHLDDVAESGQKLQKMQPQPDISHLVALELIHGFPRLVQPLFAPTFICPPVLQGAKIRVGVGGVFDRRLDVRQGDCGHILGGGAVGEPLEIQQATGFTGFAG